MVLREATGAGTTVSVAEAEEILVEATAVEVIIISVVAVAWTEAEEDLGWYSFNCKFT